MSKIESTITFNLDIKLSLTEDEAQALEVLPSYGTSNFLDFFYKNLGKHYLHPHEKGLVSLFEKIRTQLPVHLNKAKEVRKIINS